MPFGPAGLVPIGAIIAWAKTFSGVPSLAVQGRVEYVECNGQVLSNASSNLTGKTIPSLNNTASSSKYYLRGNSTSGATGGWPQGVFSTNTNTGGTTLNTPTVTVEGNATISPLTVLGTGASHAHLLDGISVEPPYYDVVWIFRIL